MSVIVCGPTASGKSSLLNSWALHYATVTEHLQIVRLRNGLLAYEIQEKNITEHNRILQVLLRKPFSVIILCVAINSITQLQYIYNNFVPIIQHTSSPIILIVTKCYQPRTVTTEQVRDLAKILSCQCVLFTDTKDNEGCEGALKATKKFISWNVTHLL